MTVNLTPFVSQRQPMETENPQGQSLRFLSTGKQPISSSSFPKLLAYLKRQRWGGLFLDDSSVNTGLWKAEHCHCFHVRGWVNYKIWFLIWSLSEEVLSLHPVIRNKSLDWRKCRDVCVSVCVCVCVFRIVSFEFSKGSTIKATKWT